MAMICSCLIYFILSSIQKSHKRKLSSFYYDKTTVNFGKGCDVHIKEAVAFLSQKGGQKWKIKWIF